MSLLTLQDFYKETITVDCPAGATNIYVSNKPIPTEGYLVISAGTENLREIIKYTATGTDGTGDYVTVSDVADRGLGGTSDIAHVASETIRMNFTAEHQQDTSDAIDQIVAGGAQDASTSTKGIVKMSVAPVSATEPIAVGDNDARLNATTGLTADEEAAIVGGGAIGTPSGTNKFVTEEYVAATIVDYSTRVYSSVTDVTKATASTSDSNLYTAPIAADLLSTNRVIQGTLQITNFSTNGPHPTIKLKYGSTTVASITFPNATASSYTGVVNFSLIANGTSAQEGYISGYIGAVPTTYGGINHAFISGTGTAAEDSTTALDLKLDIVWNTTGGVVTITTGSIVVGILK